MSEPKKPANLLSSLGGLAGAAGGWVVSQYCGAALWIPLAAAVILLVIFTKTAFRPKFFTGAIAVTGAHVVWFIIGSAATGIWLPVALDLVCMLGGIIWLWLRPGLPADIFLAVFQLASLIVNILTLMSHPIGSAEHRALTVHCIFRGLAILFLAFGYVRLRKDRSKPERADPLVSG